MPAHPGDAAGLAAAGDAARVADQATVVHRMAADRAPVLAGAFGGLRWPCLSCLSHRPGLVGGNDLLAGGPVAVCVHTAALLLPHDRLQEAG